MASGGNEGKCTPTGSIQTKLLTTWPLEVMKENVPPQVVFKQNY